MAEAYQVVLKGAYLKFTISEHADRLKLILLSTGNRPIFKASPRDKV
jgi:predicted NAD-dependent protein-ADP-ribosyltransferase YbiA (DUF1768 family)